ncbi:hypothetical protein [Hyphococcus sp.]|uniref:hypothetical protein n=1 Tax=Hyphococcus sp. TaxID=2038636 RepID=UPI00208B5961|nr:MAG: hypothetical protein DHS20C04_30400 [Marinicaulis sp.]
MPHYVAAGVVENIAGADQQNECRQHDHTADFILFIIPTVPNVAKQDTPKRQQGGDENKAMELEHDRLQQMWDNAKLAFYLCEIV